MACASSRIIEAPRANRLPTGAPSGHRQKKHPLNVGSILSGSLLLCGINLATGFLPREIIRVLPVFSIWAIHSFNCIFLSFSSIMVSILTYLYAQRAEPVIRALLGMFFLARISRISRIFFFLFAKKLHAPKNDKTFVMQFPVVLFAI